MKYRMIYPLEWPKSAFAIVASIYLITTPLARAQNESSQSSNAQSPRVAQRARTDMPGGQFLAVPKTVFIGDSITAFWQGKMPAYFAGTEKIDHGWAGETTAGMLYDFKRDALDPGPAVVLITGGTNDLAGNDKSPPIAPEETLKNIEAMADMARKNCIRVIIGSIPPTDRIPWSPTVAVGPMITSLNAKLEKYASETGVIYADFWSGLHDPTGDGYAMRASNAVDGVHPSEAGYAVMAKVADQAFTKLLAQPLSVQLASNACSTAVTGNK
jgi:lysophospholipase L1-like esterase